MEWQAGQAHSLRPGHRGNSGAADESTFTLAAEKREDADDKDERHQNHGDEIENRLHLW